MNWKHLYEILGDGIAYIWLRMLLRFIRSLWTILTFTFWASIWLKTCLRQNYQIFCAFSWSIWRLSNCHYQLNVMGICFHLWKSVNYGCLQKLLEPYMVIILPLAWPNLLIETLTYLFNATHLEGAIVFPFLGTVAYNAFGKIVQFKPYPVWVGTWPNYAPMTTISVNL